MNIVMHVHVCFSITHIIYSLGVHSNFFAKLIATAFTYLTSDVYPRVMCVLAPYFLVQNLFVMSGFDRFSGKSEDTERQLDYCQKMNDQK